MKEFFKQIFSDIWKNKFSRIIFLSMVTLIIVATILNAQFSIYYFFSHLFKGQLYDDPSTYRKTQYGFTENPKKTEKLFKSGVEKIAKRSVKIYKKEKANLKKIFTEPFNHMEGLEKSISSDSLVLMDTYFSDLSMFCSPFSSIQSLNQKIERQEKLNRRSQIKHEGDKIAKFAISENDIIDEMNFLIQLDYDYLYYAAQKKPDSLPLLELREKIHLAVCKPIEIAHILENSIEYIEYHTEKIEYEKSITGNYKNSDFLYQNTRDNLQSNSYYLLLLKRQFNHSYYNTENIYARKKKTWNLFLLSGNNDYLIQYIQTLFAIAKNAGKDELNSIFKELKLLHTSKLDDNLIYNYILAEVAYRLGDYTTSKDYIEIIYNLSSDENQASQYTPQLKAAQRLEFMINLATADQ